MFYFTFYLSCQLILGFYVKHTFSLDFIFSINNRKSRYQIVNGGLSSVSITYIFNNSSRRKNVHKLEAVLSVKILNMMKISKTCQWNTKWYFNFNQSPCNYFDIKKTNYKLSYIIQYSVKYMVRKIPWRIKWQPTPVLLPGKSHGWRSLVGYSPWGHKQSDMTEQIHSLIV